MRILVSACLLGCNCKYNGGNNYNSNVIEYIKNHDYLPICPEKMAGLSTPRKSIEILNGRVIDEDGLDITELIDKANLELAKLIKDFKPDLGILKAKSPSCGYKEIYDGSFTHTVVKGNGKACQVFLDLGIKVLSENELN